MEYFGLYEEYGYPFTGKKREKLLDFLSEAGISYDESCEYTVNLTDDEGTIAATGSCAGNVLKCIAVSDEYRGEGLSAAIVTALVRYETEHGREHLFLFTKPENRQMFSDLGFYPVTETTSVLFMENRRQGIQNFASQLAEESLPETESFRKREGRLPVCGAVIANCDPFTLGHRYLIEKALGECDLLHLFILSEDQGTFSVQERTEMVREGIRGLPRVLLHPTSDYLISQATFPTYFMKDKVKAVRANCELDVRIFCEHFAAPLGIKIRFAGTEPFDQVTGVYNETMKSILPEYGITFREIERKKTEEGQDTVSAKTVRRLLAEGDREILSRYVPESTLRVILRK